MSDLKKAAQQALEALEEYQSKGAPFWACDAAVTALRAALAQQQEQEPVAWIQPDHLQKARQAPFLCRVEPTKRMSDFVPIYTIPPAAQQAEPVAWRWKLGDSGWQLEDNRPNTTGHSDATVEPLFTHPPRREWVSLTEEDFPSIRDGDTAFRSGALWAERLLKERNT
jgi:hypothetical protein